MYSIELPFNPLRQSLYTPEELFEGFDSTDPTSYAKCADVGILSYFVRMGSNPTQDPGASTLESLHDNSISKAIQGLMAQHSKVVAIMGGHGMKRDDAAYAGVAHIAYALSRAGFLLASGGGPGAMEATHLGALFSKRGVGELDGAINTLKTSAPALPSNANKLVDPQGKIDPVIAAALHSWLVPAFKVLNSLPSADRGLSLGVPTWLYGYEPTTPFATHSGKYFLNSLREDGLVTMGVSGIVYAEGSAGTVQEIFQDAAQNYYGTFYPMVFLSSPAKPTDHFWEKKLPVRPLIEALLGTKPGFNKVLFTDSESDVVSFFTSIAP